jgi:hypothetical protein
MEWQFGVDYEEIPGGVHDGWTNGLVIDACVALPTDTAGFYVSTSRIQILLYFRASDVISALAMR